MMRWTPTTVADDSDAAQPLLVRQFADAVVATVLRFGVAPVVTTAILTLIVLALVLGVAVPDVEAASRGAGWCSKC